MKMTDHIAAFFACSILSLFIISSAQAASVYVVSDAASPACGDHGLWTNKRHKKRCNNYYSIDGTMTVNDDGTAVLDATAMNPKGRKAYIDLTFFGRQDTIGGYNYKKEGGGSYNPAQQDFFTGVEGTIKFLKRNGNIRTFGINQLYGNTTGQIGVGANAKSMDYGFSAWVTCQRSNGRNCLGKSSHWDLNLDLSPVPIPAAVWLFGSALLGFFGIRRRLAS